MIRGVRTYAPFFASDTELRRVVWRNNPPGGRPGLNLHNESHLDLVIENNPTAFDALRLTDRNNPPAARLLFR
jgi:hypothetical protein